MYVHTYITYTYIHTYTHTHTHTHTYIHTYIYVRNYVRSACVHACASIHTFCIYTYVRTYIRRSHACVRTGPQSRGTAHKPGPCSQAKLNIISSKSISWNLAPRLLYTTCSCLRPAAVLEYIHTHHIMYIYIYNLDPWVGFS